ncbi:MAG: hypothetical protein K6E47_08940, partial [Lachnospiraceae bacterium]|nr:hypothetical protein [Lachnospiraceae bacterium]
KYEWGVITPATKEKVGDMICTKSKAGLRHAVIVLKKEGDLIYIAEGNNSERVTWGYTFKITSKSTCYRYAWNDSVFRDPINNPDPDDWHAPYRVYTVTMIRSCWY